VSFFQITKGNFFFSAPLGKLGLKRIVAREAQQIGALPEAASTSTTAPRQGPNPARGTPL
jgi:hypothetical protein